MKRFILTILLAATAINAEAAELKVTVSDVEPSEAIPAKYASCIPQGTDKAAEGENISPAISWEPGPEGTKSYAVIVVDRDALLKTDDRNKEGKKIIEYAPRKNFYHWMLVNIPPNIYSIPEGAGRDKNYGDILVNDFMKLSGMKNNSQNRL